MPEFERELRQRLGRLRLSPQAEEEVIVELVGHLEDAYQNFLGQGNGIAEAESRAWEGFPHGRALARKIQRAKQGDESMNNRTKQFWLPALGTSLLGTGLLAIFENAGLRPVILRTPAEQFTTLYLPWLLSLPVFGFLGAYWSRRAGGSMPARILSGIFLSVIYFAVPWLFVPIAMVVDHRTPHMLPFSWFLLNWAILPCLALLIGALPAALLARKNSGTPQVAIHR